jgi:predicted metal-dependent hydrolase
MAMHLYRRRYGILQDSPSSYADAIDHVCRSHDDGYVERMREEHDALKAVVARFLEITYGEAGLLMSKPAQLEYILDYDFEVRED